MQRIRHFTLIVYVFALGAILQDAQARPEEHDPYLWLEEVQGEAATDWANRQSDVSQKALMSDSRYEAIRDESLEIFNDPVRTIFPSLPDSEGFMWNFWTDARNPRGILRRIKREDFDRGLNNWEIVLDIDELNRTEGASFVYEGMARLRGFGHALIYLSPGGGDAMEIREFDLNQKKFVSDGFRLPTAKTFVSWLDENRIFVATDFGPDSMTESSYPRILKIWNRGEALQDAQPIFEVGAQDLFVDVETFRNLETKITFVYRKIDFYRSEIFLFEEGRQLAKIPLPEKSMIVEVFGPYVLVSLDEDWLLGGRLFRSGSLLALPIAGIQNPRVETIQEVFVPSERQAFVEVEASRRQAYLHINDENISRLFRLSLDEQSRFVSTEISVNTMDSISLKADPYSDRAAYTGVGYTEPEAYFELVEGEFKKIKSSKVRFDPTNFVVEQFHATSRDGTRIPYSIVRPKDMPFNGTQPVLMYGYGGFQISLSPNYLGILGKNLLERGFAYVNANIRGGGEFGPDWHQSAIRENKQKSYDDFIAIAEDLIARKITSPEYLGIQGGSNGGLLMGAVLTQRPDLFGAVIIQVPLLDMKRYPMMSGAGASWIAEYGDPRIESDWAFIKKYSPYQNLKPGVVYPPTFIWTSRTDDRVAPGHARKFAARMQEFGARALYYENSEGGHSGAADNGQQAHRRALECAFLLKTLQRQKT